LVSVVDNEFLRRGAVRFVAMLAAVMTMSAVTLTMRGAASGQVSLERAEIPVTKGQTFVGKDILLPADVRGRVTILVMGFSKGSKLQTGEWGQHVAVFAEANNMAHYQMPVLESVPRMMRGMVTRSIRNGTAPEMREHFLPIFEKEDEWKKLVKFSGPEDAYVVVLDREGRVAWLGNGKWTEQVFGAMRNVAEKLN
jgi:hypothetical protein